MPPGVAGLAESGSGASRVHNTKPSGRGAPAATPRLNGSAVQRRPCAPARPITTGPAIRLRQAAPNPPISPRRSKLEPVEFAERRDDVRKDIGNCLASSDITMPFDLDPVSVA